MYGFFRCAACVPQGKVGNVGWNLEQCLNLAISAGETACAVALFPELSITSASCGDLFRTRLLLRQSEHAIAEFAKKTEEYSTLYVLGAPIENHNRLYNCCVLIHKGMICGIVPKSFRSHDGIFSAGSTVENGEICYARSTVPFGPDLIFDSGNGVKIGMEIGDDSSAVIPPGASHTLSGANLILSPSAEIDFANQAKKRKNRISVQSLQTLSARLFVSAGVYESTTDSVCSGHCIAASLGHILLDSPRFERSSNIYFADIDLEATEQARLKSKTFATHSEIYSQDHFRKVELDELPESDGNLAEVAPLPFVPQDQTELQERCSEISEIQIAGLARRMEHTGAKKIILGISGGLDSTLALLICVNTMKRLNRPVSDVIAITMPGFGTTGRTYENAVGLCKGLGTELREINIGKACLQHFDDIGHDPENRNVVYENTQARERTQILLDIANAENGLTIGTGDLSEAAMGWCTFNGDHIAMYSVNAGIPKTLIRPLIKWLDRNEPTELRNILQDIMETPVSPELLPASGGEIKQKTEDIIGPYEIHDFFLYYFMTYGSSPEKLLFLAEKAFGNEYPPEKLKQYLRVFLRRFFSQQFKRNCCQDAPKTGSVSFSPRTDWHMPSDFSVDGWFEELS